MPGCGHSGPGPPSCSAIDLRYGFGHIAAPLCAVFSPLVKCSLGWKIAAVPWDLSPCFVALGKSRPLSVPQVPQLYKEVLGCSSLGAACPNVGAEGCLPPAQGGLEGQMGQTSVDTPECVHSRG